MGSCRGEILDHVIALNEVQLRRLLHNYVRYYQQDRIHDSLDKDTPNGRPVAPKPAADARVISLPRLGRAPPSLRLAGSGIEALSQFPESPTMRCIAGVTSDHGGCAHSVVAAADRPYMGYHLYSARAVMLRARHHATPIAIVVGSSGRRYGFDFGYEQRTTVTQSRLFPATCRG